MTPPGIRAQVQTSILIIHLKVREAERKWKQVGDKDREASLRCLVHSGMGIIDIMDKGFCPMYPLPGRMKSARPQRRLMDVVKEDMQSSVTEGEARDRDGG